MNIEITFINNTEDMNNNEVVIFQKNIASNLNETLVAWRVIQNCGRGWEHKFNFPLGYEIAASDSYGNVTPLKPAKTGEKWEIVKSKSGDELILSEEPVANRNQIVLKNSLEQGAINAQIYKEGKLLSEKRNVVPRQLGLFEFNTNIWLGVANGVQEGFPIQPALLEEIDTEISLLGIMQANLVMTGGGVGSSALPYEFSLEPTR